jgi:hypothetical protein
MHVGSPPPPGPRPARLRAGRHHRHRGRTPRCLADAGQALSALDSSCISHSTAHVLVGQFKRRCGRRGETGWSKVINDGPERAPALLLRRPLAWSAFTTGGTSPSDDACTADP